ncbi:MAG: hypothetical protein C4B58_06685 [Deltaproteobacteria bacterium]|nr:MAG: hypothetical protein C4B58_06685 [Deltaproteobacteria bacterium]
MAIKILGPLNEVINKTTSEIIDSQISGKTANILNTFINAGFEAVDDIIRKVQDLTKQGQSP